MLANGKDTRDLKPFELLGNLILLIVGGNDTTRNSIFGVHRCMGNRLAEMQLRVLWEEILKRYSKAELVGEPIRTRSTFIRGYTQLPVKVHPI